MKLLRFRVKDFRSVKDSGWIETSNITALIGENESGKTNLLLALWKLNPANGEKINLLSDAPRHRYNELRAMTTKPVFIETNFELSNDLVSQLIKITGAKKDDVRVVTVSRRLDGAYIVGFPDANVARTVPQPVVAEAIQSAYDGIANIAPKSGLETTFKEKVISSLKWAQEYIRLVPL